ncbi:MAG TPA: hypothetical protein VJO35_06025 [Terriglobales bacterium]|nr:hypothetical protein [Terriglobales bacterium]
MNSGLQSTVSGLTEVVHVFEEKRYCVIRALISRPIADALCRYIQNKANAGYLNNDRVPSSRYAYGDHNMEKLLEKLTPIVEQACGLSLYPGYSYCRLYEHGAELARHRDRDACEISLSINLGQDPQSPWPLWIRNSEKAYAAELFPGDALLYRGIECEHWREPFNGSFVAQVFLHYVDKNGPYSTWKFDKRNTLNIAPGGPGRALS